MSLSLIIPIYNGGKFIEQLAANLLPLSQAINDIHFIIVNDGSHDNTAEKLNHFFNSEAAATLSYELIHKENGGVSSARNLALQHVKSDYVMFMDHDDNINATKLAELYQVLTQANADVLHFNCRIESVGHSQHFTRNRFLVDIPFVSYVWSYIYKTNLIQQHALSFPTNMKYLEDGVFVLNYLIQTQNVIASHDNVYDYVDNPDSAMRTQRTTEQNQKFLNDIATAVQHYTEIAHAEPNIEVKERLKEIRDSFVFIYLVNMLKLGLPENEVFSRLQDIHYDFKLANYPSKFNQRLPVKVLCALFRCRTMLKLIIQFKLFNLLKKVV